MNDESKIIWTCHDKDMTAWPDEVLDDIHRRLKELREIFAQHTNSCMVEFQNLR